MIKSIMVIITVPWVEAVFLFAAVSPLLAHDEAKKAVTFTELFTEGTVHGFYRALFFDRDFDGPDIGKTKDRSVYANGGALHASTAPFKGVSANIGFYTVQDFGWNDDDKNTELRTLFHTNGKILTSHKYTTDSA